MSEARAAYDAAESVVAARQSAPAAVLSFVLPYPPSQNRLWRAVNGRNIKSAAARGYEAACAVALVEQRVDDATIPRPPYCVVAHVWMPDARRRDLDNVLKAALDNCFRWLGWDDADIGELHAYKSIDRRMPGITLTITEAR